MVKSGYWKKLSLDSDSPSSISFGQVLWKIIPFVFISFLDQSMKCGHTSKQTIYSCKTLLYEKENIIDFSECI